MVQNMEQQQSLKKNEDIFDQIDGKGLCKKNLNSVRLKTH